jgi:heptosyltransferase-2
MNPPSHVLIIRPDRLGDLILSLPVADRIKMHFPQARVAYLAAPGPAQISPLAPYVDEWLIDGDSLRRFAPLRLVRYMREMKFDCALELKPSFRTATAAFFAGINIRIGTARRGYSILYNRRINVHRRGSGRHQTDLDLELLAPLGIDSCGDKPKLELTPNAVFKAKSLVGPGAVRYIVIHPGSGGSAPNWPLEYYSKLAEMIMKSTGFGIVRTGNADPIGNFDERCIDLNGKTDMESLAGIVAGAELFISGSTGPLHLADALGVRCMPFFIRHDVIGPERWGPRRNISNVITPNRRCSCRNLARCECLGQVSPQLAMEKVKSILGI